MREEHRWHQEGLKSTVTPAWVRMEFELHTPMQHPQQDDEILLDPPVQIT